MKHWPGPPWVLSTSKGSISARRGTTGGGWPSPCRSDGKPSGGFGTSTTGVTALAATGSIFWSRVGAPPVRPRPCLYSRGRLGHRGQAPTGHPDDARIDPAWLGLRRHQLSVESQSHLARSHSGLQTGGGVGEGPHRRVRRGP